MLAVSNNFNSYSSNNIIPFEANYDLDPAKTVAVLGTTKEKGQIDPYLEVIKKASTKLAQKGYNMITEGSTGCAKAANCGASFINPENSHIVKVSCWPPVENKGPKGPLYKIYDTVKDNSESIKTLNEKTDFVIAAPGSIFTLQEITGTLLDMITENGKNRQLILLGDKFYKPIVDLISNFEDWGFMVNPRDKDRVKLVKVDPNNTEQATNKVVQIITGEKPGVYA